MSRIIVSLDLETTGLDPYRDAIIEIGAVKFRGDEVLDTFSTLINPGRSIPPKITDLTSLADQDVENAPHLPEVLPRLSSFVRDLPIIAHNVSFDLSFLNKQRLFLDNLGVDTFELAGMLIPHAERYNLGVRWRVKPASPCPPRTAPSTTRSSRTPCIRRCSSGRVTFPSKYWKRSSAPRQKIDWAADQFSLMMR